MATYIDSAKIMVTCPYDPAHRILNSRFQAHIAKCRKNHLDINLKTCPFNAQHLEKEANLSHHMMNCPDRSSLDRMMASGFYENEMSKGRTAVPSYIESPSFVKSSENWDNEVDHNHSPGYIPKCPLVNGGIIGDLGMTKPAERKKFYRQPDLLLEQENTYIQEEKPKPKAEPMRQPKLTSENLHAQMKNMSQQVSKGKIAANIFGDNPTRQPVASYKNLLQDVNALSLGIGRGRGAIAKYEEEYPAL